MKRRIPVGRSVAGALVALLVSAGAGSVPARAAVKLGAPFSDGAVLQRGQPVRVWGTAVAGEKVSVSFGGRSAVATADASGAWRTELPAFEASKEPRTLVARAVSGEAKAEDVLVGEVWIAAGQSNMEFPLWMANAIRLRDRMGALTAQMTVKPCIRYAKMQDGKFSPKPVLDRKVEWRKFTPQNLLNGYVPGVGVYFALELYSALDVPIGWFACDWGGTRIEPWIPAEGFRAVPALADLAAVRPKAKVVTTDRAYRDRGNQQPTVLWNQQVASLAPYNVKGMIWYQGESNCGNALRYKDLLDGLYAGWSRNFENPAFRLYLVQIAPFDYGDGGVKSNKVREMEQAFADANPNAEIAVINDVGDVSEIHPQEKHTVGKRLAAFALANDYGFTSVKPRAPTLEAAEAKDGKFVLTFRDAKGLYAYDEAVGFELAGADGVWHDAVPDGKKGRRGQLFKDGRIVLSAKEVKDPRHVRYLAKHPWKGHVFNGSTIPLGTFHYDLPGTEGDFVREVADTYYVSPTGDDAAVGTHPFHPLRTFQAAVERVRKFRAEGKIPADRTVCITSPSGDYVLERPIVLTPADSNLKLLGCERPGGCVLRGGIELPPFREERKGLWSCDVPKGLAFEQLYVNARRAELAKSPNEGWYFMKGYPKSYVDPETGAVSTNQAAKRVFAGAADEVAPLGKLTPEELKEVRVHVWQSWSDAVARVQAFDAAKGEVVTTCAVAWPYSFWHWQGPKRYSLVNFRAALDAPGEWYLDRAASKLWYVPREGETVDGVTAWAPRLETLLEIRGDRAAGKAVRNVSVEGFQFEYAAYGLPAKGRDDAQAAINEPAAVVVADAEDVKFGNCEFNHVGAHGLALASGVCRADVVHCVFEDLGGGGVYVGLPGAVKAGGAACAKVTVDNCVVRCGGREMTGAIGVCVGHASDCRITHNHIHDLFYSGVSVGWSWGYKPTVTKRNLIAWNHIHDLGHGVMSDMAGIYTLGLSEGTEVIGNRIHDIVSYDRSGRGGWGLYTDEGSSGIRLASNLVYRLKTGPVHQNYGRDNVFENNIFAFGGDEQIKRSSPKGPDGTTNACSFVFRNNIVYFDKPDGFAFARTQAITNTGYLADLVFERNVWWCEGGLAPKAFECMDWAAWQALGKDRGSLVADPLFADPGKGDFTLRDGSPALKTGFVPWDVGKAGLYDDRRYWGSGADYWLRLFRGGGSPH